ILPANYDLWAEHGVQTDPFPEKLNVPYTSLLWEAIHKTGGSADYITELILQDARIEKGKIIFGPKAYGTLFLPGVKSLGVATVEKLYAFVKSGGKLICSETVPAKRLGFKDMKKGDQEVEEWMVKVLGLGDRFVLVEPSVVNDFLELYQAFHQAHTLPKSVNSANPIRFLMQNRYIRDDKTEFFFFQNAHRFKSIRTRLEFL